MYQKYGEREGHRPWDPQRVQSLNFFLSIFEKLATIEGNPLCDARMT
jgi:hypothetical protein